MKDVDLYAKVRHAVRIEGLSKRAAARRFGIDPRTVDKMLEFSVPPGYRRSKPPVRPKLEHSSRLSMRSWPRTKVGRGSSSTHRSGFLSGCAMSMASPAV
jgi:hypothetical protein